MPTIKVSETTYLKLDEVMIRLVNERADPKVTYDDAIAFLIKRVGELEAELKQVKK